MKKYMPIVLLVALILGMNIGVAFAAPAATTTSAEKKADIKVKIEDAKKTAIQTVVANAMKRLQTSLEKQAVIGVKLESRVVKLGAAGKDITGAIEKVTTAHDLWDKARIDFEALPGVVQNALDTKNAKDAREAIKAALKNVADETKTARVTMGEVIEFLKAGLPDAPATPAATTTPQN